MCGKQRAWAGGVHDRHRFKNLCFSKGLCTVDGGDVGGGIRLGVVTHGVNNMSKFFAGVRPHARGVSVV